MTRSDPTEPNNVTFLLKILLALTVPMGLPSASRNVNLYSKTYLMSMSQNPFLNGLGSLSTTMIFLTRSRSMVTAAALGGGIKTLLKINS